MPGPVFVEGDPVSLHVITEEDYDFLVENRNRPAVRHGIGQSEPTTRDDYQEMVEESEDGVALLPCVDGDPVGYVWAFHVSDVSRNGLIGYWIAEDEHGQGYGTAMVDRFAAWAFRDRGLHKLWAHVFVTNEGSQRVLEKNGFEREGVLRDQFWIDGEFVDAYTYGLLADEWRDGDGMP